ncbi:MAG: hypothetical protein AAGH19_08260 [Pseudomonadota bacterium]
MTTATDRTDLFAKACGTLCLLTAVLTAGLPALQSTASEPAVDAVVEAAAPVGTAPMATCTTALKAKAEDHAQL